MRTALLLCCTLVAWETTAAATDRDALIAGNTAFALDLYSRIAVNQRGNIFVSPFSISAAMAIIHAGARGETAGQIEKAMHFPMSGPRLNSAWSGVLADVKKRGAGIEVTTANALWAAKGVHFRDEYLIATNTQFGARMETLDFAQGELARARINSWANRTTREKIRELIAPGMLKKDTRLVLTNAIYMKGDWHRPFLPHSDTNGVFRAPGRDVRATMMSQTDDFRYARAGNVRALELPYVGGEFSMLILLPDANDGLAALENALTPATLSAWDSRLKQTLVEVTLPRFSSEMSLTLAKTLEAIGVKLAFSGKADLSGIAEEPLFVTEVIHKARVDVTEEGTEAAAGTVETTMTMGIPSFEPPKPEIFKADHPFFYVLRRTNGSVIFVGRLINPAL